LAGEMMIAEIKNEKLEMKNEKVNVSTENMLLLVSVALVIVNLYGLFTRMLFVNLLMSTVLCVVALYLLRKEMKANLYKQLAHAGTYLLLLGLFFEAYEGGIKKDSSTYSYYFVTGGLAFYTLIAFSVMAKRSSLSSVSTYLSLNGKNPMIAYVAGNLVLLPLLQLTQTKQYWDAMNQNFFMGLMKGVLFTGIVSLITIFFVKRKWFWKT
jgi:predicted acyltransferase